MLTYAPKHFEYASRLGPFLIWRRQHCVSEFAPESSPTCLEHFEYGMRHELALSRPASGRSSLFNVALTYLPTLARYFRYFRVTDRDGRWTSLASMCKDLSVPKWGVAHAFKKARRGADDKQDVVFAVRPRRWNAIIGFPVSSPSALIRR